AGVLKTVGRPPSKVRPVGAGFEDVVLEVHLLDEDQTLPLAQAGELLQPGEVPGVELREVVLAQPVPCPPAAAPRPRLLVEGRPHVAVDAADHLMVVPPAVVPQPPVMTQGSEPIRLHPVGELVEVIGEPRPDAAWDEPGQTDAQFLGPCREDASPPPDSA